MNQETIMLASFAMTIIKLMQYWINKERHWISLLQCCISKQTPWISLLQYRINELSAWISLMQVRINKLSTRIGLLQVCINKQSIWNKLQQVDCSQQRLWKVKQGVTKKALALKAGCFAINSISGRFVGYREVFLCFSKGYLRAITRTSTGTTTA